MRVIKVTDEEEKEDEAVKYLKKRWLDIHLQIQEARS